jgi:GNAT superfamily N-acetyltransferase
MELRGHKFPDEVLLRRAEELTPQFRIRSGEPTDSDAKVFAELLNAQYARKVTPAHYLWHFARSSSPTLSLFAECGDKPAAAYCLWILRYHAGKDCLVGCPTDLVIAPEFRFTGLYVRLQLTIEQMARKAGCACVYGSPNEAAARALTSTPGWRFMEPRTTFIAQAKPSSKPKCVSVVATNQFGAEVDDVCNRFEDAHSDRILCRRSAEHLNWRFQKNARYAYDLFVVHQDNKPFGYLVLKTFRDSTTGETSGDIVDVLWSKENRSSLEEVLFFALSHFHAKGVSRVATWLQTNTLLDKAAAEVGFAETSLKRPFCCKVLEDSYRWLGDSNRWFVTMADVDIY